MKINLSPPFITLYIIILLWLYTYYYLGETISNDKNTRLHLSIWATTILLSLKLNNNYLLFLPVVILAINEYLYINYNMDMYDGRTRTKTFYNLGLLHFIESNNGTLNLTEGLYLKPNNQVMTIQEARQLSPKKANDNRFTEIFKELNINNLSRQQLSKLFIIDMGCGTGEFLKYCKTRGINAIGVTVSDEQLQYVRNKGFQAIQGDYRTLLPSLIGKADFITFLGSLEHITTGMPGHKETLKRQYRNWKIILSHCNKYFKKDSYHKKIVSSTLHFNMTVCNTRELYLMERPYGGAYFFNSNRLSDEAKKHGYKVVNTRDMTYHYYLSSIVDKNHFGNPAKLDPERFIGMIGSIFINPHMLSILLYSHFGLWMWQFDGKLHYHGDKLGYEEDINKRPVTLWWDVLQVDS